MASLVNSVKDSDVSFNGRWEDVQQYTSAKILILSPLPGQATLKWANGRRGRIPTNDDILVTQDVCYTNLSQPLLIERDHQARWFKLDYATEEGTYVDPSLNIDTLFKTAPSRIKLVDDNPDAIVPITASGVHVLLTDMSGDAVQSTAAGTEGTALFTTFTDSSGAPLATVSGENLGRSLAVALRDNNNVNLSTLENRLLSDVNALSTQFTDACGHSQGGGREVLNADTSGISLFLSTEVDTTVTYAQKTMVSGKRPASNALYVHFVDACGLGFTRSNPLHVREISSSESLSYFDISYAITSTRASLGKEGVTLLKTLYCYNDGPNTTWLRVYDSSLRNGVQTTDPDQASLVKLNIPILAGQYNDLVFPKGCEFATGVVFQASVDQQYTSVINPGDHQIFVAGTYTGAPNDRLDQEVDFLYSAESTYGESVDG